MHITMTKRLDYDSQKQAHDLLDRLFAELDLEYSEVCGDLTIDWNFTSGARRHTYPPENDTSR